MQEAHILSLLNNFVSGDGARFRKLENYYRGNHPILYKNTDLGKPDNRLVNNFCRTISDTTVGYFLGNPLTYSFDDEKFGNIITQINGYNDEQFVNTRIARDLSVFGRAAELIYYDNDHQIRFFPLDITTVIPVYGNEIDKPICAAIRIYETEEFTGGDESSFVTASAIVKNQIIEVYDSEFISTYEFTSIKNTLKLIRRVPHFFGDIPVNFYSNNCDETGDFEPVLTLVDAYNRLQSESLNDFDLFADSYLAIMGMSGTEREDIERLRRDRVLLLEEGGNATWLTKNVNDVHIENLKNRISADIYRFSCTANLSEEVLGYSQITGVAIRYRLLNFENRISVTERYFKKGLCRRYELICNLLEFLGSSFDWRQIRYTFTRNLPDNESDIANTLNKYAPLLSKRTILERIPFIENVDDELAKISSEGGIYNG